MLCTMNIVEIIISAECRVQKETVNIHTVDFSRHQCNSKKKVKSTERCQEKANLDLTSW